MKKLAIIFLLLITLLGCSLFKGEVSGTLKNVYGNPIPDAVVVMHSDAVETTTNNDGSYQFTDMENGEHDLYAYRLGYFTHQKIEVALGGITSVETIMNSGFFSKDRPDKIYMLNNDSSVMVTTPNGDKLGVIQMFDYNSTDKSVNYNGKLVGIPSYDLNLTGATGVVESSGFIWASTITTADGGKTYLHRFDHDLNFEQSFLFTILNSYCSSRFLLEKDGCIIQDRVVWTEGATKVGIGLRIYQINTDTNTPIIAKEFVADFDKITNGGCDVINMVFDDDTKNQITITMGWNSGTMLTYKFDITDLMNPTVILQ